MQLEIAPIAVRPSMLNGLSEQMVVGHYENTYGNAVRTLNAVCGELARSTRVRRPTACAVSSAKSSR